jgi:hypothetical protein
MRERIEIEKSENFADGLKNFKMSYKYTWFDRTRRFIFREIPNFFINIYKFRKALWNHHWWDYSGTLQFIEISTEHMAKNLKEKGNEVELPRFKKVDKMNRAVEILKNIRESRYFDIVEKEMDYDPFYKINPKFVPIEGNPNLFELVDYNTEEEKELNGKYYNRVNELEEQEWRELWNILRGQDYKKFDKDKDWDEQFDGSGMRGWWD